MVYDPEQIGKTIREERKKQGWTQDQLGKMLFISGKQISNYEKGNPLPSMEVLLKLAELFNCEYGYLLGEESYQEGSKLKTAICQSLGLSGKAIDCLSTATHKGLPQEFDERQEILSRFFESPYLGEFLDCLVDAASISARLAAYADLNYQELIDCYGDEIVEKAIIFCSTGDAIPITDENETKLQDAVKMFEAFIDKSCNDEYALKVARYELREAFELLARSIL